MKITAILLLVGCLEVSALGYSQGKITLSERNVALKTVLDKIRRQTGYQYLFSEQLVQEAKKIDITVHNAALVDVLDICFRDQPFTYMILNKTILVKEKTVFQIPATPITLIDVRGKVTNEKGEPLVGASIAVIGINKGTYTDANGVFELKQIDPASTLRISFAEYITKDMNVLLT